MRDDDTPSQNSPDLSGAQVRELLTHPCIGDVQFERWLSNTLLRLGPGSTVYDLGGYAEAYHIHTQLRKADYMAKKKVTKKITRSKLARDKKKPVGRGRQAKVNVTLPTEKTTPSDNIRDYSILVHGERKIGKTTFFSEEEGAFFLEFDPLQKSLEIYQRHVRDWRELLGYIDLLEKECAKKKPMYRTVIVDRCDLMYEYCFDYMCKKLVIDHPTDQNDHGKSWNAITTEFRKAVSRLMNLPGMAARFICHAQWKEVMGSDGEKIEKLLPVMSASADRVLTGDVDLWGAYQYVGDSRVLRIRGEETVGAGQRIRHHFLTPEGEKIAEIPMGDDEFEAHANFMRAFNNEQTFTHVEKEVTRTPKRRSKKKTKKKVRRRRAK